MKSPVWLIALIAVLVASCKDGSGHDDELAVLETNYGRIVIEFFPKEAPRHVSNFKDLVRQGFYDGTKFHRIVRGGLIRQSDHVLAIQGGDPNTKSADPSTWGRGQPDQKTVPAEFSKTLKHIRGIVSAARKPDDPNSATSQFFICTAAAPQWDGNYSIFGRVIEGMNVVDAIAKAPVWPKTEMPLDPVTIKHAYLMRRSELK
jgi:cyclophilin family peptidyl-prolyl cis-trans isomerase